MSLNVEQPNAAGVAEQLPFLIDRGLAQRCKHCPEAIEHARKLTLLPAGLALMAQSVVTNNGNTRHDEARVYGRIDVVCGHCHGTGVVPTKKGWLLLGFVRTFVDQAKAEGLDQVDEIPF